MILALLLALAASAQSLPSAPATYLPQYLVTAGGGAVVPGHGAGFAYWSVSRYLGQQTYATAISEYTMTKGVVLTCPMAGITKVVYQLGPVSFGLTGAGGACSGTNAGASSAASGQAFTAFHIKGDWSIIATARKTFTASGTDAFKLTLGIGWGK